MRRVSERHHRIEGILYLYGNRVKPHRRIEQPTLLDIGPTLLALTGVPPAQDMPGRVLEEALTLTAPSRTVASYDTGERVAGDHSADGSIDPKILERLRSLGYVGAQSPKSVSNIAAMHFEAGRFAEAAVMFEEQVRENPTDGTLRTSLAGALGALGRYDEAMEHLQKAIELEPLNPEAYHNRGVIYERQGKQPAAIGEYRTALRYDPGYAPARQALQRLTASAAVDRPQTPAQQLAAKLAERASEAARRGDYQAALTTLDEAAKVAPRYALVYQYRANVAYLMGDHAAAKAALRKGLELEPDNALFKGNLKRLEETSPPQAVR
jgi:tetratricopeptide (TPR) repeat protein